MIFSLYSLLRLKEEPLMGLAWKQVIPWKWELAWPPNVALDHLLCGKSEPSTGPFSTLYY